MIILTDDFSLSAISWNNSTVSYPSLNICASSVSSSFIASFLAKNKISAVPCYFKNPFNVNTISKIINVKVRKLVKMPPLWKGDNIILFTPPPPLLRFYLISIS
jgi:hypothetical protein